MKKYQDKIVERIKQELADKKLLQKQLASLMGISEVQMSRLMNKNRGINLKTLVKIADYFNVSLDEMIGR